MNYNYYLLNSLFQNRNRYYGAYPLRLYYNERLLKSTMFAIFGFVAFIYIMRWGFHAETYAAITSATKKDSAKVYKFIDPKTIIPDLPAQTEIAKPIKGTPNTKPVITPDKNAKTATLDPKKKGALDGDINGKKIESSILPGTGPIIFVARKQPTTIYKNVDKRAEFPGLYEYLEKEIVPENTEDYGKIMLSFVVELDGSLSSLRIEQGLESKLDELALSAFKKISKPGMWKPAEIAGVQVRYRYIMPFNFLDPNNPIEK